MSTKKAAKPNPVKPAKLRKISDKSRYADDQAECSDGSEDEYEDGEDEYDMRMSMMKADEESDSEGDEDAVQALRMRQTLGDSRTPKLQGHQGDKKRPRQGAGTSPGGVGTGAGAGGAGAGGAGAGSGEEIKLAAGNKRLNFPVPAQPLRAVEEKLPPNMRWCMTVVPNPFKTAVRPALKALPCCHFRFDVQEHEGETNAGLTMQAFDNPATMGFFSRVRVSIVAGVDEYGAKLSLKELHNASFGLTSKNLSTVIEVASKSNPSAPLQFMMFNTNMDKLTVKSVADGSAMMSTFNVNLVKKSSTDSPIPALMLKAAEEKEKGKRLVFRITAQLLQQQAEVARKIGSEDLRFQVSKAKVNSDDSIKYRLSVLWSGAEIDGQQDSFVGTVVRSQLHNPSLIHTFTCALRLFRLILSSLSLSRHSRNAK